MSEFGEGVVNFAFLQLPLSLRKLYYWLRGISLAYKLKELCHSVALLQGTGK